MKVEIEPRSGFCFGVKNAIEMAEDALKSGDTVYCLGHMVHNEVELNRLKNLGLIMINHDEFRKLRNCRVIIRAHGEPPEVYRIARENGIEIIEATCPIVKKIQNKIRKNYSDHGNKVQTLIYGKAEHAEVIGLVGQTDGNSILISDIKDTEKVDYDKPAEIFSQTTQSRDKYSEIVASIRKKYTLKGYKPEEMLLVHNTICGQVAGRESLLRKFCSDHDVIIFVSGRRSSNGRMLFDVCSESNRRAYFISEAEELNASWFSNAESVGVSGATSTPKWLIKEVARKIESLTKTIS